MNSGSASSNKNIQSSYLCDKDSLTLICQAVGRTERIDKNLKAWCHLLPVNVSGAKPSNMVTL